MPPELGLIEGFFGRPWSWADRAEAVRFLRPHGFSFYLYAPKADPYLRRRWQEPHPEAELEALAHFRDICRAEHVRFGIGLSPFELHLHPDRGWQEALAAKLARLALLKPDDLAILFDDMRGDVPDLAVRQAAIVHHAAERSGAGADPRLPALIIRTIRSSTSPSAQRPPFYLEQLGRLLDPAIRIFWTGAEVCAGEFTPGHLARVAGQLGRKPMLWDNYPVNDGARMSQHLHLRAFTGRPAADRAAHRRPRHQSGLAARAEPDARC